MESSAGQWAGSGQRAFSLTLLQNPVVESLMPMLATSSPNAFLMVPPEGGFRSAMDRRPAPTVPWRRRDFCAGDLLLSSRASKSGPQSVGAVANITAPQKPIRAGKRVDAAGPSVALSNGRRVCAHPASDRPHAPPDQELFPTADCSLMERARGLYQGARRWSL